MNHVLKPANLEKKSQNADYTNLEVALHPKLGEVIAKFVK